MNRLPLSAAAAALVALSSHAFAIAPDAGEHPLAATAPASASMTAATERTTVERAPLAGNLPLDATPAPATAGPGRVEVSTEAAQALRHGRIAVGESSS